MVNEKKILSERPWHAGFMYFGGYKFDWRK